MPRLPRAPGKEHLRAFLRAGWVLDRVEGSHHILIKYGCDAELSIPVHQGKIVSLGTLKGLIGDAGLTNEEYIELFHK